MPNTETLTFNKLIGDNVLMRHEHLKLKRI